MIDFLAQLTLGDAEMRMRSLHQYMNQPRSPWAALVFWLVLLGVGTCLLIAGLRYSRRQRAAQRPSTRRLFFKLLAKTALARSQRRWLWSLARRACPDFPVAVLLTPSALRLAVGALPADRTVAGHSQLDRRLDAISRALFDQPWA